jgi:hypothetical protein
MYNLEAAQVKRDSDVAGSLRSWKLCGNRGVQKKTPGARV